MLDCRLRAAKALKDRGLLDVLRQGIKIVPGINFSLCFFRPASSLEPKRVAEYQANILSVMKEVEYSEKHGGRLDIVLFLNGLPVVTAEAKNLPTGTTFRHAEKQYREDRSPAGEPLLTFKRGALVHFAFDEDNVSMTTRLANGRTRFLPFNRGRHGGAVNEDIANEFRIAYLYRPGEWGQPIFSREVLLDVIGRFMHLETNGKSQVMIFPRFQQLDTLRKLMAHAHAQGPGQNYLIQHSAGSGKSNTIGWLEANSDPNLVYNLEGRLFQFNYLAKDEIERFAQIFYKGPLDGGDRARLEGLVKQAAALFEVDDDEGRQEEFRQLLKSYMRFYNFIAQVMRLEDTGLEKLYSYAAFLARLLPDRQVPPEIEITDDMLRLQAFKVEQKEEGDASLSPGDRAALKAISEFGAKPYTEEEQKELSEIVKAFNDRHGTDFSEGDMIRFEQVNMEILNEDMREMLRNNPADVVYAAYRDAFFQEAIRMFQRDNEMRNILLTDAEARDKPTRHFFNRALREVA